MQNMKLMACAVACAWSASLWAAPSDLPGASAIGSFVQGVEQTVVTGNVPNATPAENQDAEDKKDGKTQAQAPKQPQQQTAQKVAPPTEYPTVPAKYLRPESQKRASAEENQQAVKDLKKAADVQASKKKEIHEYKKVSINTDTKIAVKPGENIFIPISREHPNRILTPFTNPQLISTMLSGGKKKGECGEMCVRDGVIYITTDQPGAVTAFITEKDHEDIAFSLTMVPQAIPPREVRFTFPENVMEQLRTNRGIKGAQKRAEIWETSLPYVEVIKNTMRAVALGQVPDGYALRNVVSTDRVPTCTHPGLKIDFRHGQVMEGFNMDVYAGVITNVAANPVEFRNQNCGSWKNAAVTSWPLTVLRPGQRTEIYIAVKKDEDPDPSTIRKPLIPREYN